MSYEFPINLSEEEKELVRPFFTNTDKHIFALTNLPEIIKGALFTRYSRSEKGVRRLLLDEFLADKALLGLIRDAAPQKELTDALNLKKADELAERVVIEFGDETPAELVNAHVACEFMSSLGGDMLTDVRVGISPIEKSARYLVQDKKVDGKYLWYRDKRIMGSRFSGLYENMMDELFDTYAKWIPLVQSYIKEVNPRTEGTTDRAYESAIRAKACDILKNMLPASRLTNIGLNGNGRAYEHLLINLYSSELPEAVEIGAAIHEELRKVIPTFVKRAQLSEYLVGTREQVASFVSSNIQMPPVTESQPYLKLVSYEKDGENDVLAAMAFEYSNAPLGELKARVSTMSKDEKKALVKSYLSKRRNRRDKPGRALENLYYTFEFVTGYGPYRDIHRHRQLTQQKQRLTTALGFGTPSELEFVSLDREYKGLMRRAAGVHVQIAQEMPVQAQYAVPRSFYIRFYLKLNLREVYHFTELRSSKQGHIDYRRLAQEMKRQIEPIHPILIEDALVDMNEYALPRLDSERRTDAKLAALDNKEKERGAKVTT